MSLTAQVADLRHRANELAEDIPAMARMVPGVMEGVELQKDMLDIMSEMAEKLDEI